MPVKVGCESYLVRLYQNAIGCDSVYSKQNVLAEFGCFRCSRFCITTIEPLHQTTLVLSSLHF